MSQDDPNAVLSRAVDRSGSCACVGIDPVLSRIPTEVAGASDMERVESFCLGVLDSVAGVVGVVKPQSACFERFGSAGYAILERVVARARELELCVVLDAKRADIGSSAAHYAAGAVSMGAHWITVSPYMGRSSIEPFLDEGLGVFVLCRTSNPDADEIQSIVTDSGSSVAQRVGSVIGSFGERAGAVVGATNSRDEVGALREVMPRSFFLVPGVGAQGGAVEDVRAMTRAGATKPSELGVVINASRSVLYPEGASGGSWSDRVREAAESFACECAALNP